MTCVNTNSREFQILQKKSGIPEFLLSAYVSGHLDRYGEYPRLEELPNANSEPYLKEMLKMKGNSAKIEDILEFTRKNNIQEAVQFLNQNYGDLQIEILPINTEAILKITHKPSVYSNPEEEIEVNPHMNSTIAITNMVNKLLDLYGIPIQVLNNAEIEQLGVISSAKGLIYNGNIIINSDIATIDTPIHEMLHLVIGGTRIKHPSLYKQLVEHSEKFSNLEELAKIYPNRTHLDLLEESLVTELSKFMVGERSELDNLDQNDKNLILKDFCDTLDYALMGTMSAEIVPDLSQHTLLSLATVVQSRTFQNKFKGTLDSSKLTRKLANYKETLLRNNELEENCL